MVGIIKRQERFNEDNVVVDKTDDYKIVHGSQKEGKHSQAPIFVLVVLVL